MKNRLIAILAVLLASSMIINFYMWRTFDKQKQDFELMRKEKDEIYEKVSQYQTELEQSGIRKIVQDRADKVLLSLKQRDMDKLAEIVHPEKGVRFSPYAYVQKEKHIVFSRQDITKALNDNSKLLWGEFDGTGDPIFYTFAEYMNRFVYDHDYLKAPEIVFNEETKRGNSLNNVKEAYPDAVFIEYYFPGFDPQYNGMDWRALRLVFEKSEGEWYLTGIIHDEWTI